ncbi:hypothetical protein Cus16_2892 [Curtobacterium sp. ER1/6]|nr:hypothetical protein Cus16_2892 [Curtobacterium sp. ER1/6]
MRVAAVVRELHGLPLELGQLAERPTDAFVLDPDLDRLRHLVETGLEVADPDPGVPIVRRLRSPDPVDRPSVGHGQHPAGGGPAGAVEPGGLLPDLEEDLLRDLLGLRPVLEEPDHESEHAAGQGVVEFGEGRLVAGGDAGEQVVGRHGCGLVGAPGLGVMFHER